MAVSAERRGQRVAVSAERRGRRELEPRGALGARVWRVVLTSSVIESGTAFSDGG